MARTKLIFPRHVYTFRPAGSDNRVEVDRSDEVALYAVGDTLTAWAGAPGVGRIVYRVTKVDDAGLWGVVVENTIRV